MYRAGGLALMNLLTVPGVVGIDVMPATLGSALERVDGLASAVLDSSPLRAGDALVIISLSGRNALPVEMAMHARALGLRVIGVTSVAYASQTTSRHASGTFLKDHCDIVLDSKIAVGDAELTLDTVPAPFAPASTVVTAALMQAVTATAAATLADRGIEPRCCARATWTAATNGTPAYWSSTASASSTAAERTRCPGRTGLRPSARQPGRTPAGLRQAVLQAAQHGGTLLHLPEAVAMWA